MIVKEYSQNPGVVLCVFLWLSVRREAAEKPEKKVKCGEEALKKTRFSRVPSSENPQVLKLEFRQPSVEKATSFSLLIC